MPITGTLTPFDNFSGHSKIRYGVGEEIKLDVKETPPVKPPTPVEWVVKQGPATVFNNPKVPGQGTLSCGSVEGAVEVHLVNTKDKAIIEKKRFQVVAPTGFEVKRTKTLHNDPKWGNGFVVEQYLLPSDVSFGRVDCRELAAPFEGTGCYKHTSMKPDGGTGKFKNEGAWIHPVDNAWVPVKGGKTKNFAGQDTVTTVWPARWAGGGTFKWKIPQYYRVRGKSGNYQFVVYTHKVVITPAGQMTLTKFEEEFKLNLPPST
jgi:hypothetical protein